MVQSSIELTIMTKKDVLELKRRFKKNECTFTKMCGCYVNGEKSILLNFDETFLNLVDEEFYKYLEIAKKTLSGTIGNNLLELEFPLTEESNGGKQQFLMGLKESKLKNQALLDAFYQLIIDSYDYTGNFLILVFHDAYDVMTKTSDNNKLDESEEVYDYLLCAICPVTLSKPGLGYLKDENRIGPRIRDWVVGAPENGFVFPAFTDRSSDIHSIMYYTKDAKEPHPEFMEVGLGCPAKRTATEQKNTFQKIIANAIGDSDESEQVLMEIQQTLNTMVDEHAAFYDSKENPMVLTNDSVKEILTNTGLSEEVTTKIEQSLNENFGDTPPVAEHLLDSKMVAAGAQKKKEKELVEQVQQLQQQLEETVRGTGSLAALSNDDSKDHQDLHLVSYADEENEEEGNDTDVSEESPAEDSLNDESVESMDAEVNDSLPAEDANPTQETEDLETGSLPNYDVILRVKPQKMNQIKSQMIDGKKCIIIPLDENEHANVNGVTTL